MALSDLTIRQAKATGSHYTINDIDGLSLAVSGVGGKSWHFRYYRADKQKRMSLGSYPEVSLREARALRDGARVLLSKGVNPRLDRKQKRQAVQLADQNTFKVVYEKWLDHRGLVLKEGRQSTLSQIRRVFTKDVLPMIGRRSIYELQRPDLLDVVAQIERRGALTAAEKVRTWFRQLFRYALVVVPGLQQNPAFDLDVVALPQPPVRHNPFLRMEELPSMLQQLRNYLTSAARVGDRYAGVAYLDRSGLIGNGSTVATPPAKAIDQKHEFVLLQTLSGRDHYVVATWQ